MIQPVELHGAFHRQHILDILYHTDSGTVALWIGADGAGIGVRYVMTHLTILYILLERREYTAERTHLFFRFGEHMQYQT